MTQIKPKRQTIVEALLALEDCTRYGARFISPGAEPVFFTYREVVARAKNFAGALQAAGLSPSDRVAIVLPTSINFLDVFLGTQLAGGVPTALYPPFRLGKLDEYFKRTRRMLTKIGARFLVTDSRVKKLLGPAVAGVECVEKVFEPEKTPSPYPWKRVDVDPDHTAFLQFSSGTTVDPKAVVMSNKNLVYNLEMIDTYLAGYSAEHAEQGGVSWLPLYHDMGLVGGMYLGLYHPGTATYIPPEVFIVNPAIWLQTLSRYKGVLSAAPNFAYGLCVSKIKDESLEGVDLSNWELAMNGAEPIDCEMMNRFIERFSRWGFRAESMTPVYGLAEAGLAVSFSDPRVKPLVSEFDRDALATEAAAVPGPGRRLPSVGRPVPGLDVRICDENDQPMEDGRVGKILIQGPSITVGYFNSPDITAGTIRNGWLDTGDLGFMHDGDLYIAGRLKDLIIIRGRNYAPQEIEELLNGVDGVRPGCAVAVSQEVDGTGEQLIVLAERDTRQPKSDAELEALIRERIINGIALTPYHVQMLDPGTLPRTSSGKMRRSEALRLFVAGELAPPEKVDALKLLKEIGKSQVAWGRFWLQRKTSAHS